MRATGKEVIGAAGREGIVVRILMLVEDEAHHMATFIPRGCSEDAADVEILCEREALLALKAHTELGRLFVEIANFSDYAL